MAGKRAMLMKAMADQILRFIEGVHEEGGVRRVLFAFPSEPVVVMVVRQSDYDAMGQPEHAKGPHKFVKATVIETRCGWCNLPEGHPSHGAAV